MDIPLAICHPLPPTPRKTKHLTIGCLIFPEIDQIDFTGPFEVLSRIPKSTIHVIAKKKTPVRDMNGLILTPEITIAKAPTLDVLLVPGGFGQQKLMRDKQVLSFIRKQFASGRMVFSVCTGALLCGAAGILRQKMATTHWAAWDLLQYYGALATRSRVVVDGNLVTCAGVTAGLDGALVVASLLRSKSVAEQIQLSIEYDPTPFFHNGNPDTATEKSRNACRKIYAAVTAARKAEAQRFATTTS